jgi:1-acyl-sn-glycerol-3-phosphate acyltransferase
MGEFFVTLQKSLFMRWFCGFLLKLMGWKLNRDIPEGSDRCVLMFAPHTSAFDFVVGKLALVSLGLVSGFLIKKEAFWFPMGLLLKALGAVPVDRKNARNITDFSASLFDKHARLSLMIAPEGTRKRNDHWKRGFYVVAQKANVPIAFSYMDWKTKTGGIGKLIIPSGDYAKDLAEIQAFYKGMQGKNKGCFNLED